MGTLDFGAKQAVQSCMKVKKGENVVVITDRETVKIADAIIRELVAIGGLSKKFVMEDFGPRPEDGVNSLKFPDEIAKTMSEAQVSFYIASSAKGEFITFRQPMLACVEQYKIRHGHMIGITEQLMLEGMSADYTKIQTLTKRVYDIASNKKIARVTTPAGCNFSADFNPTYKWIIDDGNIAPGHYGNLPAGEIFTSPVNINGKVVIDGCLGDYLLQKYGDLQKTPLSLEIKDGRCVKDSISCKNHELQKDFEDFLFKTDENSNRVGEFGIGTNTALEKIVGNLLQDEKFPGVHIAFGFPFPELTGANWTSKCHLDCVLRNTTIVIDDLTIMQNGKFKI